MQAEKAGISPLFRIFREVPSFLYPISTRTAAAEVRNITASAQSEAGVIRQIKRCRFHQIKTGLS